MLGVLLGDEIELMLGNAVVVAWALIIGGFAILVVERFARPTECDGVANVSLRQSAMVGLVQCLAMIPGVSRSGATILGAMSFGVDRKTAAEFSFFLAVPTLIGATALQLFKHGDDIPTGQYRRGSGSAAWSRSWSRSSSSKRSSAIVTRYGFAPFAWYRIVAGAAALVWLCTALISFPFVLSC